MKLNHTLSTLFIILLLVACSQTPATKSTSPSEEEIRQTSPSKTTSSSQTAEAEPNESQSQSKSDEAASAEASTNREAKTPSETPAGSEPPKPEQRSEAGPISEENSAEAQLAEAREKLRISQETEKRIAGELDQLKASGSASEEAIRDYETYLTSVQAMTAENRQILKQMEAAYAQNSIAKSGSVQPSDKDLDEMTDPAILEEQTTDDVEALDRQLNASLAKFDGMLLKEMEEIRAGSSKKLQGLAEEAAEAARRLREKGLDVDTSGSSSTAEGQERTPSSDQEMQTSEGRTGTDTAAKTGSSKSGEGSSHRDKRRADYEDDDIVARQLREAAENETDPELKEKLWKEYEEYKKSQ